MIATKPVTVELHYQGAWVPVIWLNRLTAFFQNVGGAVCSAEARTLYGIAIAAGLWVATALLVAMPSVLFDLSKFYLTFLGSPKEPGVLAALIFVDLVITYFLIPDDRTYKALTSRPRLGTVVFCLGGFVAIGTLGVEFCHGWMDRNPQLIVTAALALIAIPRGLSYAVPTTARRPSNPRVRNLTDGT
jgi:hypothetical protein